MTEESILVVPTLLFHQLGYFQGFTTVVDHYRETLLSPENVEFRPRSQMEKDPAFKQLIPYMLFCHTNEQGEVSIFSYIRGKGMGEARLHSKRSIGIGGHINAEDLIAGAKEGRDFYHEGMNRELQEEVCIGSEYVQCCVGLINDDSTEVGKVHLGIVHRFDLKEPLLEPNEKEIIESGFVPVRELLTLPKEQFENWTAIVLQHLFGEP